jgi:hypothetical protein
MKVNETSPLLNDTHTAILDPSLPYFYVSSTDFNKIAQIFNEAILQKMHQDV